MKFFVIEWWDSPQGKYHQEYFQTIKAAFSRFDMLCQNVQNSNPDINTLHTED